MYENSPYIFGSYDFLAKMESFFESQAELLGKLIILKFKGRTKDIQQLIIGIQENAYALKWLKKRDQLNEAIVIMRVFIERIITFCYLLSADDDTFIEYSKQSTIKGKFHKPSSAITPDEIIAIAREYHSKSESQSPYLDTRKKIEYLREKAELTIDPFLISIKTFYPDSQDILNGSPQGCILHLGTIKTESQDYGKYFRKQFSMIFYIGVSLIDQMVNLLSKHEEVLKVSELSKNNLQSANQILNGDVSEPQQQKESEDLYNTRKLNDLWYSLDSAELSAQNKIMPTLSKLESAFMNLYLSGVQNQFLPKKSKWTSEERITGLFLKRSLNDFRCVLNLLNYGYTSQAASIAASLWEHAITVEILSLDSRRAKKLQKSSYGELPWNAKTLSQMAARGSRYEKETPLPGQGDPEYESFWRAIYGQYQFLCSINLVVA